MNEIPLPAAADWSALVNRKVLFGHQSVGGNILAGLGVLASEQGVNVRIEESRNPGDATVEHFKIGVNGDPLTKIRDFQETLEAGAIEGADVAMMKLCYLDFGADTDAHEISAAYTRALDELEAAHPNVSFVAVTTPLTTIQVGPKAWVKKMLGRQPAGYQTNLRRHRFNEALRARFGPRGRLFDVAALESRGLRFQMEGEEVEALDPALTSDGGHLNEIGQRLVASALVEFLATVPSSSDR